jgi:hypothetical protein
MGVQMDRATYPGKPRVLSDRAWFYEQPNGLGVVIEVHRNGKYVETSDPIVPSCDFLCQIAEQELSTPPLPIPQADP